MFSLGGVDYGGGGLSLGAYSNSAPKIFDPGYFSMQKRYNPYETNPKYANQRMFGPDSIRGDNADMFPGQNPYATKKTIWSDLKDFGGKLGGVGEYEPPVPLSGPRLGRVNAPRGGKVSYRPTDLPQNRYLMGVDDYNARREAALKLWSQLIRRNTYQPLV